jgi:acetyl esterase/lipase
MKRGFVTTIQNPNTTGKAPPEPPSDIFELVKYTGPLGEYSAYVSPVQEDVKRPGIIWVHGGFDFGIDEFAWQGAPRSNDQSASVFRENGLVLMLPSLRGTNDNPGANECFLGEVDDVIAAGKYLATRPDVDPNRIYLGGHSTGGTMAVLVAVSTDVFRGIFAFGPVLGAGEYGVESCPNYSNEREAKLRTAAYFLRDIKTPTFLIEGEDGNGPYDIPPEFKGDAPITTVLVPNADHFSVIRPGSEVVVAAIQADTGETASLPISVTAIVKRMDESPGD